MLCGSFMGDYGGTKSNNFRDLLFQDLKLIPDPTSINTEVSISEMQQINSNPK